MRLLHHQPPVSVHFGELLALGRQLFFDIGSAENRLEVHPVLLHLRPLVQSLLEQNEIASPFFYFLPDGADEGRRVGRSSPLEDQGRARRVRGACVRGGSTRGAISADYDDISDTQPGALTRANANRSNRGCGGSWCSARWTGIWPSIGARAAWSLRCFQGVPKRSKINKNKYLENVA